MSESSSADLEIAALAGRLNELKTRWEPHNGRTTRFALCRKGCASRSARTGPGERINCRCIREREEPPATRASSPASSGRVATRRGNDHPPRKRPAPKRKRLDALRWPSSARHPAASLQAVLRGRSARRRRDRHRASSQSRIDAERQPAGFGGLAVASGKDQPHPRAMAGS